MVVDQDCENPSRIAFKHPIACFLAAFRFLTVLPTFTSSDKDHLFFKGAVFYFTITGILTGSLVALVGNVCLEMFPPFVAGGIIIICLSGVSGFLHLDGLADTADGFMSPTSKDRCLDIMRDSRIGVMGASALCFLIILKVAACSSIDSSEITGAIIIASAAGRTGIVVFMAVLPYARESGGLGRTFSSTALGKAALVSSVVLLVLIVLLSASRVLLILLGVVFVSIVFGAICKKRISGVTGDTLGAVCELVELAVLIVFTMA